MPIVKFINKGGASYVEYFMNTYDVSYTLIQTTACDTVVFESTLTQKDKEELLSRNHTYEMDFEFCIVEMKPLKITREIVVTGEEYLPAYSRTPVPDKIKEELDIIERGYVDSNGYFKTHEGFWDETTVSLMIHGEIALYTE